MLREEVEVVTPELMTHGSDIRVDHIVAVEVGQSFCGVKELFLPHVRPKQGSPKCINGLTNDRTKWTSVSGCL